MKKSQPNWHGLNMLPMILDVTQGQLAESKRQLKNLEACQQKPHVLDSDIVTRIIKSHTEQNELTPYFIEQCQRWRRLNPNKQQLPDIQTVEDATHELEKINNQILFLAEHYKDHTIDAILEKDPFELALDCLTGKAYPPSQDRMANRNNPDHFLPNQSAINALYQIQPKTPSGKPDDLATLYDEYKKQRILLSDFHNLAFHEALLNAVPAASELGNIDPSDNTALIDNDSELNLFYDYITLYRSRNKVRHIVDWLNKNKTAKRTENTSVVDAYCQARFAALRIDKNLEHGAMSVVDVITEKPYLLIDKALNHSKKEGLFFLCSMLDMGSYVMTGGCGIPIDGNSMGGQFVLTLLAKHLDAFRVTTPFNLKISEGVREIYGYCLRYGAIKGMTTNQSL